MLVSSAMASAVAPVSLFGAAVRVRAPEGSAHGFLVLRGTEANVLAEGDWWQIPSGDRIEVHLRFRFTDGSLSHETFELAQHRVWSMLSYRSVQHGPSFPRDVKDTVVNRVDNENSEPIATIAVQSQTTDLRELNSKLGRDRDTRNGARAHGWIIVS